MAVWGLVPTFLIVPVAYAAMWVVVDPVTVAPETGLEAALTPVIDQLRSVRRMTTPLSVVAVGWAALVWREGLKHRHGLDGGAASVVAAGVGLLLAVGVLL